MPETDQTNQPIPTWQQYILDLTRLVERHDVTMTVLRTDVDALKTELPALRASIQTHLSEQDEEAAKRFDALGGEIASVKKSYLDFGVFMSTYQKSEEHRRETQALLDAKMNNLLHSFGRTHTSVVLPTLLVVAGWIVLGTGAPQWAKLMTYGAVGAVVIGFIIYWMVAFVSTAIARFNARSGPS